MIGQARRTPPCDPWSVQLTYQHDQRWWFDANQEPASWHVSADVYDDSGTHIDSHVGDITIVLVDIDDTDDPFGLLDGEDADLGLIAEAIFNPATGGLDPELNQRLQPLGTKLLILGAVRLSPQWRGFGLGVLLAGTAIKKLSSGARAAVCYPAPLDTTPEPADPVERALAIATLGEVWAQLGFEHFRHEVHLLDLNLVTLDDCLTQLRQRAEQYRTFD
jgi:GNAT superfamily N-acetyltransferase